MTEYINRTATQEDGYYRMPKDLAQKRNLSFAARGMLAYIMSKPPDWRVMICDLEQECKATKVKSILKELIAAGYIKREQKRGADGKMLPFEYYVSDSPRYLDEEGNQPQSQKPGAVKKPPTNKRTKKQQIKQYAASGGITGADAQEPTAQDASEPTEATAQAKQEAIDCQHCSAEMVITVFNDGREEGRCKRCGEYHQATHCPTCTHKYRTLRDGNNAAFQVCNCTTIESLMADGWLEYPMPQDYAECYDPPPNCETPRYASSALIDTQPTHAPGNMADFTTDKCPDCGECMTWQSVWSSLHWRWCDVCGVKRTGYDAWHGQPSTEPFQDLNAGNPTFPPPIDENGNWVESLTHPGMVVERVSKGASYPPNDEQRSQNQERHQRACDKAMAGIDVATMSKAQIGILADLAIAQDKQRPQAYPRIPKALTALVDAGYARKVKGSTQLNGHELTDKGAAAVDTELVQTEIENKKASRAYMGTATSSILGSSGKKRTKGKFNLSPEYQPIFDELCALFSVTPATMTTSEYKRYAGVAKECATAQATPDDVIATHRYCKTNFGFFGVNAITTNLGEGRKLAATKQSQVDTTLQFDESGYGESE